MKKTNMLIVGMVMVGLLLGATAVHADGYPFGVISKSSSTTSIVIGKFSTQFTQKEAQDFTAAVVKLIGSSAAGTTIYTPNDFAAMGITDADVVKLAVRQSYKAMGANNFIFLDIKKTAEYAAGYGYNIRIDVYLPTGTGVDFAYLLSLETSYLMLHNFGLL
jgi:hypothetical protein